MTAVRSESAAGHSSGDGRDRPLPARHRAPPDGQVPLHIFEDRYKELIDECLAESVEISLVYADDDGLRPVGTLAYAVTEVIERFDDGRLNVVVEGRARFRVVELTSGRSFFTAEVEPVEDQADQASEQDVERALRSFTGSSS